MEITPPISPNRDYKDDDSNEFLRKRGGWGFHCIGEASRKISFDPQGFLLNGHGDLNEMTEEDTSGRQPFITVFKELYDIDSPFPDDLQRLFMIARNRICLLESAQKMNIGAYGMFSSSNLTEPVADLEHVRQELREFFVMLRVFVNLQYKQDDSIWLIEETLPILLKGLKVIRAQLGWITDLPSHIFSYSHIRNKAAAPTVFHLFHSHLELRWLHLSVLWIISMYVDTKSKLEASQVTELLQKHTSESSIYNILQSAIKLCVTDLFNMAVIKFNKTNLDVLAQTSIYNCMCVKELWLLLRFIMESTNSHSRKSFWELIESLLGLLKTCDKSTTSKIRWRPLETPSEVSCNHPALFSLWFLQNIGDLFTFTAPPSLRRTEVEVEGSHITLKGILSDATSSSGMDEAQRRVLIALVKGLMEGLWKSRPEPIMILWESFCRNLDDAFLLQGAPLSSYVLPSETIKDIINSVNFNETAVIQQKSTNSFTLFLYILGKFLKHDPSQWKSKMRGRFCSKLSEKKVNGLKDRGLFHLTQLFLTVAMYTEADDVVLLFQKLVCFNESDAERNSLIMKAKLSFLYLLMEQQKPVTPHLQHLAQIMNSFNFNNQVSVVQVFVNNLRIIINSCNTLPADLHLIFGDWISSFLRQHSRKESVSNLLGLISEIMKKVLAESNNAVGAGMEKLVGALCQHVLPYVKEHKRTIWEETADVAVCFTLAALEFRLQSASKDSYESLLQHFLISDTSNIVFVRRYLQQILRSSQLHHITAGNESQQVAFIQAWVRCCTLNTNFNNENDVTLTKKIFSMPYLQRIMSSSVNSSGMNGLEQTADPFVNLIECVGNKEITVDKKEFTVLIEPMTLLVQMVKSSLFPMKPKDTGWKVDRVSELPKDAVVRAFYVFGKLASECSTIIYEKNSSNFLITLVNTLIIPPVALNMDKRLPSSMDEGLRKSLHFYLIGLHKLDPEKDPCIKRLISTIVEVYVPRFATNSHLLDPFRKIWDEPAHMPTGIYTVQIVCDTLLHWNTKTNSPHKFLVQGLYLINDLIRRNSDDDVLLGVVIGKVFPNCLVIVAKSTDISFCSKKQEIIATLKLIFHVEAYLSNPSLWTLTDRVLSELSDKYLSFSSEMFCRMLSFLSKDFKTLVKRFLPSFEQNLKQVIAKRGSGKDKFLESFLTSLKSTCSS